MSGISTHILDTALGRPAAGVRVTLERLRADAWLPLAEAETDRDGRCMPLLAAPQVQPGTHRLTFHTAPYFAARRLSTLYPQVTVAFTVAAPETDYHIPLLLTPHSYTTYRGT